MDAKSFPVGHFLVMIVWPPAAALLVATVFWFYVMKPQLQARPPVAVMDVQQALVAGMKGQSGVQALQSSMAHTKQEAKALTQHGYLVLNSQYVFAYPSEYEVDK